MTAKHYQKRYKLVWDRVYKSMMACKHDANAAHNAAFLACDEIYFFTRAMAAAKDKYVRKER